MTHSPQHGDWQTPPPPSGLPAAQQHPWNPQGYGPPGLSAPHLPPPAAHGYLVVGRPVLPVAYKDSTAAWLFWFFLGGFGAHHFYLGRTGWGVAYAVGFVLSWLTTILFIGFLGLLTLFVLWIVDATRMSGRLQRYNAHAWAVNRSLGLT